MKVEENWKDVVGYEGLYKISDLGNVMSLRGRKPKLLKPSISSNGYKGLVLCNDKQKHFTIHKLVAMAYLGHEGDGQRRVIIDHINNIKTDNRLVNLQILSARKNLLKNRSGTSLYPGVSWCNTLNKWKANIYYNGSNIFLGSFEIEIDAAVVYYKALESISNYTGNRKQFLESLGLTVKRNTAPTQ